VTVGETVRRHRLSILFLVAALAAVGIYAALKLPVSLFPTVDFPRVAVNLDAGDRPAEQMEMQVTRPIEDAVRGVAGIEEVRSTTSRGTAEISLNFGWGIDMATATLQVNAAIGQILSTLPAGTSVTTRRMDPTVFPIIAYSLTSSTLQLPELRDIAEYALRPLLSSVKGVGRVQTVGGAIAEIRVTVDPDQLRAYALTLDDVAKALSAANVVSAVGHIEDRYKLYLVVSDTRLQTTAQIRQTVLKNAGNGLVRLGDVADVQAATVPQWIRVTADGQDSVLLNVYQQPGSNSVQIAKDVKARLDTYRRQLPRGVSIANWYDQSELVLASVASVRDAILIGIGLAALVLFAFLRNLRMTSIALIVVPATLATTIALLHVLGMSFNIMTLGGMAAAVGLIIDDAIVMIEHIEQHLRRRKQGADQSVMRAAVEFLPPLTGSSAATIIIFVPLAFLTGVTGAFFKALAITMASALFISFVFTAFAVPLLADRFLGGRHTPDEHEGRTGVWLRTTYGALLTRLLAQPLWLLVGVVPLLILGWLAFRAVGSGFMPAMDEGGFVLDYRSTPGTALTETDRLLRQVEAIIKATPDVQTYSRRTGTGLGGGLSEANQGDFFVRLKSGKRRPVDQVMEDIRGRIERDVPGLSIEMAQLLEDLIGDLTAVPQPVEVRLFSDSPKELPPGSAHSGRDRESAGRGRHQERHQSSRRRAGDSRSPRAGRNRGTRSGRHYEVTQRLSGRSGDDADHARRENGGSSRVDPAAASPDHPRRRQAHTACARRPYAAPEACRQHRDDCRAARNLTRQLEADDRRNESHQRPRSRVGRAGRQDDSRASGHAAQGHLLRAGWLVSATADRVSRLDCRVRIGSCTCFPAALVLL
jgi:multidrug efflux pump subunit AcrB